MLTAPGFAFVRPSLGLLPAVGRSKMPNKQRKRKQRHARRTHKKRRSGGGGQQTLAPDAPTQVGGRGVAFTRYLRPTPFPTRWRIKMTFSEQRTLTASAVNTFGAEVLYRLNSAYIPAVSSGTVKPFGYTQMSGLYQSYRVFGVNIDITFSNPTEVEGTGMTVGALLQNSQGTVTLAGQTYNSAAAASGSDLRQLNNTGTQIVRIQRKFTIPQIECIRHAEWIGNNDYVANSGANPAATPFLRLAVLNDVTLVQTSCTVLANLTFDVEWYNRLDLS